MFALRTMLTWGNTILDLPCMTYNILERHTYSEIYFINNLTYKSYQSVHHSSNCFYYKKLKLFCYKMLASLFIAYTTLYVVSDEFTAPSPT